MHERTEKAPHTIEKQFEAELDAMTRLHNLSMLTVSDAGLERILSEIVDVARSVSRADFGSIQLLDRVSSDLRIVSQGGFPEWWLDFWQNVPNGQVGDGAAREPGERVIVEDIEQNPTFAGTPDLEIHLKAGVRALQSTPLISRSGKLLGMFSTHYKKPHRPDEHALRLLDLLARQAADVIEHVQVTSALRLSEERYRVLAEQVTDGIFLANSHGRYLDANRAGYEMLGYTLEEFLGLHIPDVIVPDELPRLPAQYEQLAKGRITQNEWRFRRKDGSVFLGDLVCRQLPDGRCHGILRDMTERRRVEAESRAIMDLAPGAVFVARDPQCLEMSGNRMAYELSRLPPGSNLSKSAPEGQTPDAYRIMKEGREIPAHELPMQKAAATAKAICDAEFDFVYQDGRRSTLVGNAVPLLGGDGRPQGSVGVFHDITDRKRAEEALRRSEARWNAAIENLEVGVIIATDAEQVIYRNPAARAMQGFTSDQSGIGPLQDMTRIFQLRTPDGRLLTLDEWPMRRIKRGETLNRLELRLCRPDQGWEKIISYSGATVESAIGERLMFVSAQDLTDQRRAEHLLRESEERLRLLGDNLPDSAVYQYVRNLDGSIEFTYCSAGIERINGIPATELLRDAGTLYRQILPEYMDRLAAAELVTNRDLSDFDIELPMRRPDGEVRWIHLHSRPRRLADGRTIWDGVETDVTARKQAEDALKKHAELLRLSYDGMIVRKLDGAIESWNVGAERLYGYSEAEAIGKLTDTLLAPQFPKPWKEILEEMRFAGSWEGELRQQTRDGREVVVSARIQLIKGSDGIDRVLEVNRDITEARRAQFEAFARQKLESLGTLASGIAHDFNNLLGAVLAQAELAAAELAAGAPPHQELEAIREVAIRGSDIVRQLMIYAGKESDVLEFIDISKTVEEMGGLLKSAISKRTTLVTDLSEHLPVVKARTAQIRQVLMNLVVNASDAMKGSDGVIRVTTRPVTLGPNSAGATGDLAEGDYVELEVSDTGSGMPPDIQARMFDPFFSTKSAGRGLGLAVIHGIVRSLRGAIRVQSEVAKGTTFQILFPSEGIAALPIPDTLAGAEEELHRSSEATTVLVVEDEAPLRIAVKKMLGKAGYTVLEAADGSEAVQLLHSTASRIDLLFLDMTIPGCSSHEVLREAVEGWPQVKVILTSAYGEEMVTRSLSAPQVRGFVRKPFQLVTLLSALQDALSS